MTLQELKNLLSRFHIRPDKSLGQNFLLSEKVLDDIIAAAELTNKDLVLEIGPGLGVLTRRLADNAGKVLAVEKDHKLSVALRKLFKNQKNVKIINEDALFLNPPDSDESYKIVANIPYYITGKLLQNFLNAEKKPSLMVLLVQKEVGERITAASGEMSVLAVSVQLYADPEIISIVSKQEFYPKPEVDSAVIRLRMLEHPRFDVDERKFFQLVKIGFSNKRKQLQNNLAALDAARSGVDYKLLLSDLGLNPLCRAQDLSLRNWYELYQKLNR